MCATLQTHTFTPTGVIPVVSNCRADMHGCLDLQAVKWKRALHLWPVHGGKPMLVFRIQNCCCCKAHTNLIFPQPLIVKVILTVKVKHVRDHLTSPGHLVCCCRAPGCCIYNHMWI